MAELGTPRSTAENQGAADLAHTEAVLRRNLTHSNDPQALVKLAAFLMERGVLDEAESLLSPAVESGGTFEMLDLLSTIQYRRRDFSACEQTLGRLLALAPQAPLAVYQLLAKVISAAGRTDEARAVMKGGVAAHRGATEFVAAYADMLPIDEAVLELERHLNIVGMDPARAAYVLVRRSVYKARGARVASGRPFYGTSWRDTYQWPDHDALPELKSALQNEIVFGSRRASAWADLGCIAVAEGNWERAEECFSRLRNGPKRTVADFHAFGRTFHAALDAMSDTEITDELAPVERLTAPAFHSGVSIFIGSDPSYFTRFSLPFIRELEVAGIPLGVHAHVLDGTPPMWAEMLRAVGDLASVRLTLTAEASGAGLRGASYARNYFHAVRYVRAFEELKRTRRPLWVMDADVRLLRDPRVLLASLGTYDIAVSTRPSEFSPSLKMSATCVGLSPTPRGLEYARRVAAYIAYWKARGTWGWSVDQTALFSSYAHMSAMEREPSTLFLDDMAINDKSGDSGALKFYSGIDKHTAA